MVGGGRGGQEFLRLNGFNLLLTCVRSSRLIWLRVKTTAMDSPRMGGICGDRRLSKIGVIDLRSALCDIQWRIRVLEAARTV